jgi:hypothetical protein
MPMIQRHNFMKILRLEKFAVFYWGQNHFQL